MNIEPGTAAYKAYFKGVDYAITNKSIKDCPYITSRTVGLKNWFEKGYNETTIGKGYVETNDESTPW